MSTGKLYLPNGELKALEIDYQLHSESGTSWWGELSLVEYKKITEGGGYTIELEDRRRGHCYLQKRVNRAVTGIPPRYVYRFTGSGAFSNGEE
ncbi:MAG: hypothetical protein PHR43_00755 [Dehalococcoidales bacterium]|nr:hypothetical protein [Dehalococcoidales bacterium]